MDPALWEQISAVEDRHWWFTARREILLHVIGQLVPDGTSILDIGCGTGFMLEALRSRYDAWGLEPDPAVRARTRAAVRGRVLPGDAADFSALGQRRFELVLLLDVLEHVEDDVAALRSAMSAAAVGGRLLLTVPGAPELWSRHDERNGHFRRYSVATLRTLLDAAEFTPATLTHFNSRLLPLAQWHRRSPRADLARELLVPARPVNALFRRIFAGERHRLPAGFRRGLSLLAISQPSPASP